MIRRLKKTLLTVLFLGLLCSQSEAKLFDMDSFELQNGLRVIVIPNHKAPIVKHMVWYQAGAVDEPIGKGGVAHLLEHLMFRGTKEVEDGAFNEIVIRNGADMNAFTSYDMTAYHEFSDLSRLELMMALEADRMANLEFDENAFKKEQQIVFQERKQVVENNPTAYFSEMMRRNLWQEHPYSRPITGTPEEILSLTSDDVWDFYHRFYAPNNAILVLSGDIDSVAAKTLAEKHYGKIARRNNSKTTEFPKLENTSSTKTLMKTKDVSTSRFVREYIVPSYRQDKQVSYALAVLSTYLGEGETSFLYRQLVKDENVTVAISTDYDFTGRSYGTFRISAVLAPNVSPAEFEEKLDEAMNEAVRRLNWDTLSMVKNKMLAGLVYLKDNPSDAAYIAGAWAMSDMPLEDIENYDENVLSVKLADVHRAASLLKQSISSQGFLLPEEE